MGLLVWGFDSNEWQKRPACPTLPCNSISSTQHAAKNAGAHRSHRCGGASNGHICHLLASLATAVPRSGVLRMPSELQEALHAASSSNAVVAGAARELHVVLRLAVDYEVWKAALQRLNLCVQDRAAHDDESVQTGQPLGQRAEVLLMHRSPAGMGGRQGGELCAYTQVEAGRCAQGEHAVGRCPPDLCTTGSPRSMHNESCQQSTSPALRTWRGRWT